MKNTFLIICTFILFYSCNKSEDIFVTEKSEFCPTIDPISAPTGFDLKQVSHLNFNMHLKELQFVSDKVGYILGQKNVGGYVSVLKTEDKGVSWQSLTTNMPQYPINFFFKNEKEGFISIQDVEGCPSNCQNVGSILKTKDGGLNWETIKYPNLKGILYHLKFDSAGNAFAMLSHGDLSYSAVKSTDNCATWTTLFSAPDVEFRSIKFSYTMIGNNLYLSGRNGKIIKIDKNGQLLKTIETGETNLYDVKVVNDNVLIAEGAQGLIKTTDAGVTWTKIYHKSAKIIDFSSENEGIVVLNKSYCQTDVYQANDVIASTKDGGLTWQEGKEATNLMINYANSQVDSTNKYYFLIGKRFIEFKKK